MEDSILGLSELKRTLMEFFLSFHSDCTCISHPDCILVLLWLLLFDSSIAGFKAYILSLLMLEEAWQTFLVKAKITPCSIWKITMFVPQWYFQGWKKEMSLVRLLHFVTLSWKLYAVIINWLWHLHSQASLITKIAFTDSDREQNRDWKWHASNVQNRDLLPKAGLCLSSLKFYGLN